MIDQELMQLIDGEWEVYRRADRRERLAMLRHRFSMFVAHVDDGSEFLHIGLDDAKLSYQVNKAAMVNDDHSLKGFVRFVFALREGETKTFTWVTAKGHREWILSRDPVAVLYVDIPEIREGIFIRYTDFRDECFAAYEKCYGWGYEEEVRRIEVPAEDYDFLRTLDVQEEFELVRFLDDGQSFETTDADRLLRYIEAQSAEEEAEEEPDDERIRRFNSLYEAVRHYLSGQGRLRRTKKLRHTAGIFFSDLKYNWEECDFRYNVSMRPDDWHEAVYRRYGDLPNGRHFGVYIWPKSEAFAPASAMMIVDKSGEMRTYTLIKESWSTQDSVFWPEAAAAAPSGKSIVWLKDGEVWVWRRDRKYNRFLQDDGENLKDRIEGLPVRDVLMRTDGILLLFVESDERKSYAYLCDEDIVLVRYADGDCWIPANDAEAPKRNAIDRVEYWPDSFAVMIRSGDDEYDYYDCGVRRACFEPGLEVIKPGILAGNPDLESVTIPASVKEVGAWAFGSCTNLKELVIEGDLSRVAEWAPDAFEACACEEEYLRLRNTGAGN